MLRNQRIDCFAYRGKVDFRLGDCLTS